MYLMKRFPEITSEGILSSMKHYVTQKSFFAHLAVKLGLVKYIQIIDIPAVRAQTIHINEDVFEAFNGAFFQLCEEKIFRGSGYQFVYNLVEYLLQDETIPTEKESLQKPRAVLKEVVDTAKLTTANIFKTSNESRIVNGVDRNINIAVVVINGKVYGRAESFNMDDAKDKASLQALEALRRQGITADSANERLLREKRRVVDPLVAQFNARNPGLDYRISIIKKADKNSSAIVGYYIKQPSGQPSGQYQLQLIEHGVTPEAAEETILRKLLNQ